jgi:hypothetical protein
MVGKVRYIGLVITLFCFFSCLGQQTSSTDSTFVLINPEIEPTLNSEQRYMLVFGIHH